MWSRSDHRCAGSRRNTDRIYPFQVLLPADETGLDVDSKAQAEQIRSVAVEHLGKVVGSLEFAVAEQPARHFAYILASESGWI